MTEYAPDSWVIIRITNEEQVFYKVLGGWSGGYLNGDSWRLNSGIDKCVYDVATDRWQFYGSSGSVYNCHVDTYGLRMSTAHIWNQMLEKYPDQVELLENRNWAAMDWSK